MKACIKQTNAYRTLARSALAGATSLTALVAALPAAAQDQSGSPQSTEISEAQGQEIIVTGIRGSLQRNLDAKREASGVVDVISAEDIGKFPDSNVAASLQRLPGVSIQRDGTRGEANGVTIRGFGGDFNETLIDGRRLSTATGGRSIDFSTVGSDFVGALTVYKTPDVSVGANSIGATINISYPKPFDRPGFHIAASASGSIQDDAKRVVPTGGLLISHTFADDTFGVLADVIYTRHDTRVNNVYVTASRADAMRRASWPAAPPRPAIRQPIRPSRHRSSRPWSASSSSNMARSNPIPRTSASMAASRSSGSRPTIVLLTLDDNYSDQRINADTFGFGIWFNQGSLRNVKLDGNGVPLNFTQAGSQTDFTAGPTATGGGPTRPAST
jgi:iron complex outermembrane receptor protein